MRRWTIVAAGLACLIAGQPAAAIDGNDPGLWTSEWPNTDFSIASVSFDDIKDGGPPKDGIPPIDEPVFARAVEVDLPDIEPVIGVIIDDIARAYPVRLLIWHEIVNDWIDDLPIAVTFCPLCNTGIVFDRRVAGDVLDFGTTGKLRNSDLVMYDRQTESWWQQFTGEAIVGVMTGQTLTSIPARLESYGNFRTRAQKIDPGGGWVLVPNDEVMRAYGITPYVGYDSLEQPFLYNGPLPTQVAPLARVVRVGEQAWSLDLVKEKGEIMADDTTRIRWEAGQSSALDRSAIAQGLDVGNVVVEEKTAEGNWVDAVYTVDFAFAFRAFYPDVPIATE
ncbi:MAG: DUF3179 domain-containing protein [Alphaproteobacteria bacterium]|nr:DUF3179 domain-containing protein [Alphaproteobacteria bacterium]